jgi:hypothetical protein
LFLLGISRRGPVSRLEPMVDEVDGADGTLRSTIHRRRPVVVGPVAGQCQVGSDV